MTTSKSEVLAPAWAASGGPTRGPTGLSASASATGLTVSGGWKGSALGCGLLVSVVEGVAREWEAMAPFPLWSSPNNVEVSTEFQAWEETLAPQLNWGNVLVLGVNGDGVCDDGVPGGPGNCDPLNLETWFQGVRVESRVSGSKSSS